MSFVAAFQRGQAAARAELGQASFQRDRNRDGDRAARDVRVPPIHLGYFLDRKTGRLGIPLLYGLLLHLIIIGLNGAGKQTRILTPAYMTPARDVRSMFIIETKGTAALQTADERRTFSDTKIVCPFPVLGLKSDGWNPLRYLNPKSPYFLGDARALARAMIDIEAGTGMHWTESATGLVTALIMWEVIEAAREKRFPSLLNVRMRLTEPERAEWYIDKEDGTRKQRRTGGLSVTAARMINEGGPVIASLVGRFVRTDGKNELAAIQSTADTQTQFLLNDFIAADLAKGNDVDLTQLSQRPMSIYWVCAGGELEEFRRHTRMGVAFAVRAHMLRTPRMNTLFVLDEYPVTVGKLGVVFDNWALVREYGIQFLLCAQSAVQLQGLHGNQWENLIAQSGCVAAFRFNDQFSAEYFSKRCGITTELQRGFNINDAINGGGGTNAGSAFSNSGPSSNNGWGDNHGYTRGGTFTVQPVERAAVRPQELMDMQPGEGRIWIQGAGTESIPFFASHYFERRAPWVARVKPNPYYLG